MHALLRAALRPSLTVFVAGLLVCAGRASADEAIVSISPSTRSAVLFKNGMSFLRHEIVLPAGATTTRIVDLPVPAHGTFWITYDDDAGIGTLIAGMGEVESPVPIRDLKELLRANPGERVKIWTVASEGAESLEGTLLALEAREPADPQFGTRPDRSMPIASASGPSVVLLRTGSGVAALRADSISRVDFDDDTIADTLVHQREAAFLRIQRPRPTTATTVTVTGLVKGLAWVPSYSIDISDPKTAILRAKAVIVNEAVDLDDVHLDLATGFPHAMFGDVPSALTPGQGIAEFFASLARRGASAGGITTRQVILANASGFDADLEAATSSPTGQMTEDLFLYPIEGLTLRRGESAYLPLFSAEVPYRRVYTWNVGGSSIADERWTRERGSEITAEPVWNTFRFTNPLEIPLTTAATEFQKGGVFVGQDVCLFTAPGQESDVRVNRAMNVVAEAREIELSREHTTLEGTRYDLVRVRGELRLLSRLPEPADVEITQRVAGEIQETSPQAEVLRSGEGLKRANPTQELRWKLRVEPGASMNLSFEYQIYVH